MQKSLVHLSPTPHLYLIQPWPCSCCPKLQNENLVQPTQKWFYSAYLQHTIFGKIASNTYSLDTTFYVDHKSPWVFNLTDILKTKDLESDLQW